MSYLKCISNALRDGEMTSDAADAHRIEFDKQYKKFKSQGFNDFEAERAAAKETWDVQLEKRIRSKRNALFQARTQAQNKFTVENYTDVKGNKDIIEGIRSIFDQDAGNQILSITNMKRTELGLVHAPLAQFMEKYRTSYFGRRNKFQKMTTPLIIKEILEPGSTANPLAKEFAAAINQAIELARTRHNQFGGNVAKIKGNYLPQPHNPVKVGLATQEDWIEYILPKLDLERMINNKTGRSFTREELVLELPRTYDAIRTEGVSQLVPGSKSTSRTMSNASGMTANARLDHRFLVFKDADSYMAYQAKFGDEDVISTIYQHLESISRDTAMMRALGPNPNAGFRYLVDLIRDNIKFLSCFSTASLRSSVRSIGNSSS